MHKAPSFVEKLQNTSVAEGHPVRLECRVAGVPFPQIFWKRENESLTHNTDRIRYRKSRFFCTRLWALPPKTGQQNMEIITSLKCVSIVFPSMHQDNCGYLCMIIQPAMKEDAGWYTVSAKNDAGIVSSTARLDVNSKLGLWNTHCSSNQTFLVCLFSPTLHIIKHPLLRPQLSGSSLTSPGPRRCVPPPAATPLWQREGWTWRQHSSPTPARCSLAAWWKVMTCRETPPPREKPESCPCSQHAWNKYFMMATRGRVEPCPPEGLRIQNWRVGGQSELV